MKLQKYKYTATKEKLIEKIISDENVNLSHVVLPSGEELGAKGIMALAVDEGEFQEYSSCFISVDYNVKMKIENRNSDILEFFVVKTPAPDFS